MYLARFIIFTACLHISVYATTELVCSVTNTHDDGPITHGSYTTFNCSWTGMGVDNSNLNWYRIDSGEEMTKMSSENGEAIWRITGFDNGIKFLCIGQNLTSKEVSTCSLAPLVVLPTVSVGSLAGSFVKGEEASFACNAEGLPQIAGYRWYIDGVDEKFLSRFTRQGDGKIVTIAKLMQSDNGSVITCEAFVPSGLMANASLTIDLAFPFADGPSSSVSLWIFIACAAAGGIPVFVLMVVCLAWCLRKTRARSRGSSSKKRSQSRRHIVLNEELNETHEPPREELAETSINERLENGLNGSRRAAGDQDEDDGSNPPIYKPAPPPPTVDPDSINLYVNTPAPASSAATLPNRPTSPVHYVTPRPSHQRKKTEYENVARVHNDENNFAHQGDEAPRDDVYENVAPSRPLSPKPALGHTSSLPNFSHVGN